MVNRGGVGSLIARGRALTIFLSLVLGGSFLLRHDFSHPQLPQTGSANAVRTDASMAHLPLSFEPNQGQGESGVKFLARGSGYGLYLSGADAVLALPQTQQLRNSAVRMRFAGANPNPELGGTDRLPGHSNYFIGNDPSRWHRNIPQFSRVRYRSLYPGIDLDFYGKQGRLEYDFEVYPGADPRQVELEFEGAQDLRIAANGDLILALDDRELRFEAPHVYQVSAAGTADVSGSFILRGNSRAGFEVGDYDRSRTLVIDPVLTFSTFLGGSGAESCAAITGAPLGFVPQCPSVAVDSASRVYLAGATTSAGASFTGSGATPPTLKGPADVFVARISNSGTSLAVDYVTYLGGSGTEYPAGVAVDSGFNVYIAGTTNSADFPVVNAFQSTPGSAANHVFLTKLDSSGSANLYSTYLSSAGTDIASGLALDSQGRMYVMGTTTTPGFPGTASTFPTTAGALQGTAAASSQFFFSKVNPTLSGPASLLYSTFIGGSTPANGVVTGGAIAVDSSSNVYLAGGTNFTDMPVVNAFQATEQGGFDVWAARLLAPATNTQQYTASFETYFGGSGDDVAYGVATDGTSTYVTGSTTSTNITIPSGTTAFQGAIGGGTDAFVAKFGVPTTTGTTQGSVPLSYFTYLGGSGQDVGLSIVADANQNARLTGRTTGGFPNLDPLPGSSGGGNDAFFARIVTTATSSTNTSSTSILGGSGSDIGTSTAVDSALNSYVAGETSSGNFPVVIPAQGSLSGPSDAFVSLLGPSTTGLSFTCNASIPVSGAGCPSPAAANPGVNPSPVGVGNQVTFRYSIYNQSDPVNGVVFTGNIGQPPNSSIVSATASSGTCTTTATTALCNLGTVNTSTTTTGTTPTTAAAATVTIVVTATPPTSTGVVPPKPPDVGNSATLTIAGTSFLKSISGSATVNDFGIQQTPITSTVTAGNTATYSLLITPTGPFPESVSISCGSGLPASTTCSFASGQNPIPNLNNGPQSRTLDINTTPRVTTPASLFRYGGPLFTFWLPISGLALVGGGLSRKRRWLLGALVAGVLGVVTLQAGCGSSGSSSSATTGTPAGSYTITVNATSGGATRTTAVQLTVR